MRHAARVLALCYAALVTVGPLAHAAQERTTSGAAFEESHTQACTPAHDPATCPVAGLSHTEPPAHRLPGLPSPLILRESTRSEARRFTPRTSHGPERATGPPSLVLG